MGTHINLQTSRVDEELVDEVLVQTALSHLTQKLKPKLTCQPPQKREQEKQIKKEKKKLTNTHP